MIKKLILLLISLIAIAYAQSHKEELALLGNVKNLVVEEEVAGLEPVLINSYNFDESGNLIKSVVLSYDLDNNLRFKIISYYENDVIIKQEKYSPSGDLVNYSEYIYDDNGNILKQLSYSPEGVVKHKRIYNYENGLVKTEDLYSAETLTRRYINEYDADGNRINRKRYDINGVLDQERIYDIVLNTYKEIGYNSDGEVVSRAFGQYDKKGRIIKSTAYTMDGSIQTESGWIYDNKGLLTKEELVVAGDNAEFVYDYEFDEQGNWISRTVSEIVDGEPLKLETIVRTIEYY